MRSRPAGVIRRGCTVLVGSPLRALDQAREVVSGAAVGARPDEVIFTASAPQARTTPPSPGFALGRRRVGSQVVTTAIDHSSVLAAAAAAGSHAVVKVDHEGHADLDEWTAAVGIAGTAAAWFRVKIMRSARCSHFRTRPRSVNEPTCRWSWMRRPRSDAST